MKKKLLIISLIIYCSSLFCQTDKTVFRNSGKIYVGENASNIKCALYISGSLVASDKSLIQQNGHTILKGNFYNNVSSGNIFSTTVSTGKFEFRGDKVQYIRGTADKIQNFINFPDLVINNATAVNDETKDTVAVIISPNMGISTKNVSLYRGRLILDSKAIMNGITDTRTSEVAHLLVQGDVTYDMLLGNYLPGVDDKNDRGIVQMKLGVGDHYKKGYLIGFTPPFKKIYTDYFFYNFVARPTNKGLFGDSEKLIISPKVGMESGKGYIIGFGIVPEDDPYYEDNWDPEWSTTVYSDRFKDMMSFARNYAPISLSSFVNGDTSITDRYTGEVINTKDVPVQLEEGWNYIGNPFTVPINMSSFLDEATIADQWGVTRGLFPGAEVENKYYIMTQGYGTYYPENTYHPFRFDVTYLLAQKEGNTITLDGKPDSGLIAPMQLFVILKNTPGNKNITIPESIRSHGDNKYLRGNEPVNVHNELLIETRDGETNGYDRLCVVFRDEASSAATDVYDAGKLFNESEGVSQIYTMSSDNELLTTNVIPTSTIKLGLYLRPSHITQSVSLKAYRLSSLTDVYEVKLEDKKLGQTVDLLNNPEYNFLSSPTDSQDRFILHFRSPTNIEEENQTSDINVFCNRNVLYIRNLTIQDQGNAISIIDIQGRNVYETTVTNSPELEIPLSLNRGVYIFRLTGRNDVPITRKFVIE